MHGVRGRRWCLTGWLVILMGLCDSTLPAVSLTDPVDGMPDATAYLRSRYGFLPMPLVITEPAVGYGGGAALAFLHDRFGGEDGTSTAPPSISMIAAGGTENGTWFTGGGHFGSWFDDQVRYVGFVGRAHLNVDWYIDDDPVSYTMDTRALVQRLTVRLPGSDWFVGMRYYLIDNELSGPLFDLLPDEMTEMRTGGLGASVAYDSRDNLLTPTKGIQSTWAAMSYAPAFGGEASYRRYESRNRVLVPLYTRWRLGLRLDGQYAEGDVPFWHLPAVDMRGISLVRYMAPAVLVAEGELLFGINDRFWLVGFGGAGAAEPSLPDLQGAQWHPAGGGGVRYLVARGFGLLAGVDVATSEDGPAIYLTIGNAWTR